MAMAASARGGGGAAAQRTAQYGAGSAQQQLAGQTSMLRAQEQMQAQQQLGGALQQREQLMQQYLSMGLSHDQAQFKAQMDLQQLMAQQHAGAQQTALGAPGGEGIGGKLLGAGIGAAASIGAAAAASSDRSRKKKIKPAGRDMKDFLSKLKDYSFEYKNESKPRYGIMAQDLEKSKVGRTFVMDTPEGKMVDTRMGFGAVLAASRHLHERLAKLEGKHA